MSKVTTVIEWDHPNPSDRFYDGDRILVVIDSTIEAWSFNCDADDETGCFKDGFDDHRDLMDADLWAKFPNI